MKKIIGIMLIGLLGFLGCSDGNDGTNTFKGEAIPVAPFGIIETPTPTYEWTPVPGATKYQLLVEDIGESVIIEEWYTAEEVESASEDGLCSVTPDITVLGDTWKVLACAGEACGLWSDELEFSFTVAGPTPPRFTDYGDGTVTDNNTKLMWLQNPNLCGVKKWQDSSEYCTGLTLAGHSDWRLPALSELKSLIDTSQRDPALPPGHPFTNVRSDWYWSSTTFELNPPDPLALNGAWFVDTYDGAVSYDWIDGDFKGIHAVWPVRSDN